MIEVHLITEKELSETLRTARNDLFWQFCDTALWWENDDPRDAKAAELLYSLSLSIDDVEDATLIAYLELFDCRQEDEDEFYELLNSTGRSWFPPTADAFVRRFISERARGSIRKTSGELAIRACHDSRQRPLIANAA